jgi:hypothetical protein
MATATKALTCTENALKPGRTVYLPISRAVEERGLGQRNKDFRICGPSEAMTLYTRRVTASVNTGILGRTSIGFLQSLSRSRVQSKNQRVTGGEGGGIIKMVNQRLPLVFPHLGLMDLR